MLLERRFAELCFDEVMQYCLPYNMKILIPKVKRRSRRNEVFHCDITGPARTNPVGASWILIQFTDQIFYLKSGHSLLHIGKSMEL